MTTSTIAETAAIRLRDATIQMIGAIRCNASTEYIEARWKHIEEAYNALRYALEKKVSEG